MATIRFTAGPWNVHEGNETFGPGHRKSIPLEEKMKKYAEIVWPACSSMTTTPFPT